jgi:hypothetical protein
MPEMNEGIFQTNHVEILWILPRFTCDIK